MHWADLVAQEVAQRRVWRGSRVPQRVGVHAAVQLLVRKAVRTARALPRGKLLVLPRTGHVAQIERPRIVAAAMIGMIKEDTW